MFAERERFGSLLGVVEGDGDGDGVAGSGVSTVEDAQAASRPVLPAVAEMLANHPSFANAQAVEARTEMDAIPEEAGEESADVVADEVHPIVPSRPASAPGVGSSSGPSSARFARSASERAASDSDGSEDDSREQGGWCCF